jgi:hypothetical protein
MPGTSPISVGSELAAVALLAGIIRASRRSNAHLSEAGILAEFANLNVSTPL